MIRLSRDNHQEDRFDVIRRDIENGGSRQFVAVSLKDGCFALCKTKPSEEHYFILGVFDTRDVKVTQKNLSKLSGQLLKMMRGYDRESLICYGNAVKKYGKKAISKGFITTVDNPYYKCAAPMRLYDENVIRYHIIKQMEAA